MKRAFVLIFFTLCTGCSPQRFFYFPNRALYLEPEKMGLAYTTVSYPSLNGKTLYALWFQTSEPPKGTVVHLHGNYGNVSNHFPLSIFLLKEGFDVLVVDYQGYGASEGTPNPRRTMEDGIASVRYAQAHLRDPKTGVVLFGQSLGGATAILVAAKEPLVKAVVLEAPFSSYRSMARDVLKRHVWTWPFYPIAPLFLGSTYDPIRYIDQISPRPLFLIHGDHDTVVPVWMSHALYEKAREPKKLWIVPGADHLACHRVAGEQYVKDIAEFFSKTLEVQVQTKQ